MKVGVIDYGVGNLGSVLRALEVLRVDPCLVTRPADLSANDCLILPGVGNFTDCATLLEEGGWIEAVKHEVNEKNRALLGICVGMQLLADFGEEGVDPGDLQGTKGLGLVPGRIKHLRDQGCGLRLPHVGWNQIDHRNAADPLLKDIAGGTDFYFTHSYSFIARDDDDVLATVRYGIEITAAVRRGRVWGTQFHPEKSSKAGFRLLRNFLEASAC